MILFHYLGWFLVIHLCYATNPPSVAQHEMNSLAAQMKALKSDDDLHRTQTTSLKFSSDLSPALSKFLKSDDKIGGENEISQEFHSNIPTPENKIMKSERGSMISREFPCPLAEAIAPCVCEYNVNNHLRLDCSEVASSEQLHMILSQDFPAKDFYEFNLHYNDKLTFVTDISSGLNFQGLYFFFDENLELISDEFLLGSADTLEYFAAMYSQLHRTTFPFLSLPLFTKLMELNLSGTKSLTSLPKLESESLTDILFTNCSLQSLESGTFDGVTNLDRVGLEFNNLTHLGPKSFLLRNSLKEIYLGYNGILNITPGAFVLADDLESTSVRSSIHLYHNNLTQILPGTFPMADRSTGIYLSDNQISEISPGAFVMPNTTDSFDLSLSLYDNNLTELEEEVFSELFPYLYNLWIEGNPFTCGCSMAWLVLNEAFMNAIDDSPTCANGTLLAALDPAFYEDNC